MRFVETELEGAYVLDLEPIEDERGFFGRAWCKRELEERGLSAELAQCNLSLSRRKGTLRGLHFQIPPHAEVKVVRCVRGAMFDVIVDLRRDSATYTRWIAVELSADNRRALYVPEGFAHGFQTLADETETFYMISAEYSPDAARGLRWNDDTFGIEWPDPENALLSERDRGWPDFVR
jgi:dTDP-4-dehydrorhamnose 3,5-epimerase